MYQSEKYNCNIYKNNIYTCIYIRMKLEQIGNSYIYYNDNSCCLKNYYNYILSLIKEIIISDQIEVNIILGNFEYEFNNTLSTKKIIFNYDSTISIINKSTGIEFNKSNNYEMFNKSDIIIDYSMSNIIDMIKERKRQGRGTLSHRCPRKSRR